MPNIAFKNYFFKLISLYIEVILDLQEKFSNKKIWPQFPFKFFSYNNEDSYETLLNKTGKKPNDCLQTKTTLYRNI